MGDSGRVHEPGNAQIEAALIGAIFQNPECLIDIAGRLRGDHFYEPLLGEVFDRCAHLFAQGKRPDARTLAQAYRSDPRLERATTFWQDIADMGGMPTQAAFYAEQIVDAFQRRSALLDLEDAREQIGKQTILDERASETISDLVGRLISIEEGETQTGERSLSEVANSAMQQIEAAMDRRSRGLLAGLTTGITKLDDLLGGFQPTRLVIMSGRTSMGKTALAVQAALRLAQLGHVVWFRSFEMSAEEICQRCYAIMSGVPVDVQTKGTLTDIEHLMLKEARAAFVKLPLHIDDDPPETIDRLSMKMLRAHYKHNMEIAFVDYLQMLRDAPNGKRRYEQLGDGVTRLKGLAKQLHIPVVALAQLGRQVDDRPGHRPVLSDLRESGNIEQDADVSIMLHRPGYYQPDFDPPARRSGEKDADFEQRVHDAKRDFERNRDVAECIVNKNRQGPTGRVFVYYKAELMQFTETNPREDD